MHPNIIPPSPRRQSAPFFRCDGTDDKAASVARTAHYPYRGIDPMTYHRDARGSDSVFRWIRHAPRIRSAVSVLGVHFSAD